MSLKRVQGDTWDFPFSFIDNDTQEPISLVGKRLYFTLQYTLDDTENAITEYVDFADNQDSQNGIGTLIVSKDKTKELTPTGDGERSYYYFTMLTPGNPDIVETKSYGQFTIIQGAIL